MEQEQKPTQISYRDGVFVEDDRGELVVPAPVPTPAPTPVKVRWWDRLGAAIGNFFASR